MNGSDFHKKYKIPKQRTSTTTNPESSTSRSGESSTTEALCPLLAKDSEWVDVLQVHPSSPRSPSSNSEDEEVLQLVECEDGPQMKPLAIMFPGILDKDPKTLQGILDRAISTTEVTRHLVGLRQKANFTFMKKADRLIPKDKKWLKSLSENSESDCSSDNDDNSEMPGTTSESDGEGIDDYIKRQNT